MLLTNNKIYMYKGYVLKHPITGDIRYVGITTKELRERLQGHIRDTRNSERKKWHKSCWMISVYRECKMWPNIELVDVFDTLQEAKRFEVNYIAEFKEKYKLTNDTAGGDYVAYKAHTREAILKRTTIQRIKQYNIYGELLHEYDMIEDAVKSLKLSSGSKITMCCKHKRLHAHGYIWRYYHEDLGDISSIDKNSLCFNNLLQCDLDGNILHVWDSYHKASKAIGDNSKGGNIAACVSGKQKTCKGYIWKLEYKGERSSLNLSNSENINKTSSQAHKRRCNDYRTVFKQLSRVEFKWIRNGRHRNVKK